MNKTGAEAMFRRAGCVPVARGQWQGHDIYVADGFSRPPHSNFRKFGIEPTEPAGYLSFWWVSKDGETMQTGGFVRNGPFTALDVRCKEAVLHAIHTLKSNQRQRLHG